MAMRFHAGLAAPIKIISYEVRFHSWYVFVAVKHMSRIQTVSRLVVSSAVTDHKITKKSLD